MRSLPVVFRVGVLAFATLLTTSAAGQKLQVKFALPVAYDPGPGSTSVAIADLSGDGKLDLVVANFCKTYDQYGNCSGNGEGGVAVLLGNGDGTFQPAVTYSTGAYGANSVAVADMNGDGILDLVVANWCGTQDQYGCRYQSGAVSVLFGNGDGTFQTALVYGSGGLDAYSVAIGDLNGDRKPDLVVTNSYYGGGDYNGSVGVLLGNGDGTFQPAVSYGSGGQLAASVAIGDVNVDGIPDLVVADYGGVLGKYAGAASVLLGNGDGTFQPGVLYDSGGVAPVSVALGDLRGNGIRDVVIANRWSDNEGKVLRGEVSVLLGNGDGTFQSAASYLTYGVGYPSSPGIGAGINSLVIADLNGDGIPDLAVVEWCQNLYYYTDCVGNKEVNVFLGKGDGTFQAPFVYSSGGFIGSALAVADVNRDGRPDLIVANNNAAPGDYQIGLVAVLLNKTSYATTTVLTSSPNPSHVNQTVTLTATITSNPPIPNGEVITFSVGTTKLGTGKTTRGVATLTTSFSKANTYTVKAKYPGDVWHKPSYGTVSQVVNP